MTEDRIVRTLEDLLEFADVAERLVERGRKQYETDEMLPLAAEAVMHKIGETVARLPEDFTTAFPQVRWRAMRGLRNKIAHEYRLVDHALIWSALETSLPADVARIRSILDRLSAT